MKITVEGVGDVDISNREDYNDFLNSEGVKCVKVDGVRKSYGNLVNGGTYTLGPPIQQVSLNANLECKSVASPQ